MMLNIRWFFTTLFFFFLPWQTRWIYRLSPLGADVEYGRLSLYGSEIVLGILMVLAIVAGLVHLKNNGWRTAPLTRDRWWLAAFFAVILYGAIRSLFVIDTSAALLHTAWLLEAGVLAAMIISGFMPRRAAINGFLIGMTLAALLGIGQVVFQYAPAQKWLGLAEHIPAQGGTSVVEYGTTRFLRAYGSFPHPNIFGGYLVVALLIVIARSASRRSNPDSFRNQGGIASSLRRASFFVMNILITHALALTFSRSAWLAWLCGAIVFWFLYRPTRRALALSALGMSIALLTFWPVTVTRFKGTERLEKRAIDERITSIHDGIAIWKQSPWFGVGPGNFVNTFFVQHPNTSWWQLAPPHNVFLAILAEYGIVGSFLLAIFFIAWCARVVRTQGNYRLLLMNAPLIVLGFFDHYLWSFYCGLILATFFLAFVSHTDLSPTRPHQIHF